MAQNSELTQKLKASVAITEQHSLEANNHLNSSSREPNIHRQAESYIFMRPVESELTLIGRHRTMLLKYFYWDK